MANVAPAAEQTNPNNNVDGSDAVEGNDSSNSAAREPVDRDDLRNRGLSTTQVDAMVVQRHQNEVLAMYFRRWLFFYLFVLCILGPTTLGLLVWLIIAWNEARTKNVRCDSPLIQWASLLYAVKMYYFFLHQFFIRCCCQFNPNQEPRPRPPRRVVCCNVSLALFDFLWNIAGIMLAGTSTDCKDKMPGLYHSTLSFASLSIFLTLFMVINNLGIHSILAYLMRSGMLRNNAAAPSGTLEEQKLVPFDSPLLKEEDGSIGACSICFEDWTPDAEIRETVCHHPFHSKCLKGWLQVNHTCPLCRQDLRPPGTQIGQGQGEGVTEQPESQTIAPTSADDAGTQIGQGQGEGVTEQPESQTIAPTSADAAGTQIGQGQGEGVTEQPEFQSVVPTSADAAGTQIGQGQGEGVNEQPESQIIAFTSADDISEISETVI